MKDKLFRFLRWFCPEYLVEEIEGDHVQKFTKEDKIFSGEESEEVKRFK